MHEARGQHLVPPPLAPCRYVVKCMKPPMSIFHGLPGTAYQFEQPGTHNELKHIETAKTILRQRFLHLLQPRNVKYELHLYAENVEAPAAKIGTLILEAAQNLDPTLVVTAAHNKVGFEWADGGQRRSRCVSQLAAMVLGHATLLWLQRATYRLPSAAWYHLPHPPLHNPKAGGQRPVHGGCRQRGALPLGELQAAAGHNSPGGGRRGRGRVSESL